MIENKIFFFKIVFFSLNKLWIFLFNYKILFKLNSDTSTFSKEANKQKKCTAIFCFTQKNYDIYIFNLLQKKKFK